MTLKINTGHSGICPNRCILTNTMYLFKIQICKVKKIISIKQVNSKLYKANKVQGFDTRASRTPN